MRPWVVAVAVLAGILVVAELLAVPVAERALTSSLERCIAHERLTLESVRRPVLPRLAVGHVRDVEVVAEGIEVDGLRVDRVRARIPEARLPWALGGAAEPTEILLQLEATEEDLQAWLRDRLPLGIPVTVELSPDVLAIGVERLPFTVDLDVAVVDGVLTLRLAGGDEAWWRSLGLAADLPLPMDVDVRRVELGDARLLSTVRVDVVAGITDAGACEGPLARPAA